MANLKRSWETMIHSDDEEEPSMGRQTLPVARLPDSFSGEPTDGMQYLFTVRRDARKLPIFTRVVNPVSNVPPKAETTAVSITSKTSVPLPSEEWRAVFIKRFRNFRKNSVQATIGVELPLSPSAGRQKVIPEKKERDKWLAFINGRPEIEWNPPKKLKKPRRAWTEPTQRYGHGDRTSIDDLGQYEVSYTEEVAEEVTVSDVLVVDEYGQIADEQVERGIKPESLEVGHEEGAGSLPTPFATPQPESRYKSSDHISERKNRGPRHPTPSLLKPMDSRYCMHLLMYFTHWISQHLEHLEAGKQPSSVSHLSQNHARWIFALLSRVDEQLTSDELSSLRALARACIALIKDLNKNGALDSSTELEGGSGVRWIGDPADAPMDERACWMVVAIITDFWGQRDLWMDAESALNKP